jgi:DNA-binding NtrC family response regulator
MAHDEAPVDSTVVHDDGEDMRHSGFRLVVLSGELRGREMDVTQEVVHLGKSRQCDIVLPDESVSRVHAEIRRQGDAYRVLDQQSTNGVFIGGVRVTDGFLKPGDVLALGKVQIRFMPRDARVELLPSTAEFFGPVRGRSLAMRKIFGVLERVAGADATILLEGETGTGKDLLARAIHDASPRKEGPFVVVDCGGSAAAALEVELFGSEGAFTGAQAPQGGLRAGPQRHPVARRHRRAAARPPAQADPRAREPQDPPRRRQRRAFEVDVRVLATANRGLQQQVAAGEFREDLYFLIAVVSIQIPAVRDRRDDIPMLIELFSRRLPPGMWRAPGPEAMARLVAYDWPGNVRELRNVVERSAYLSPDGVIDLITAGTLPRAGRDQPVVFDPTLTFREQKERAVELFEETYLNWLLQRSEGNISRAAREADMDRKYLHKLLRRYGIDAKQFTAAALGNRANADANSGDPSA